MFVFVVVSQIGIGWNQVIYDYVFFQIMQEVVFVGDCCFGEDVGGFLE